ncbi:MAG: protein kinase family protein [Adhaeribacter sp.]
MANNQYKFGGNGKVFINKSESIAIKTLKDPKNRESKVRFLKELKILSEIKERNIPNLVELIDINEDKLQITMPLYEGDLTSIYHLTAKNVKMAIELLIPVVKALEKLAQLDVPIFHRDLKPANILVKNVTDGYELIIADFGCAYFKEEFSPRDTPDFRAVGAQHFRAPEYDYGRVEEINEKGDVFSIGKILWCMINGVYGEVFPYTLWFPNEYNLESRIPTSPALLRANLIIASCVDIEADKRPSYKALINMMENLISDENPGSVNDEVKLRAIKFEALRKVKEVEIKALVRSMLEIFYQDMHDCLKELEETYRDFELVSLLNKEFSGTYNGRASSIDYKVNKDTASYIFSTSFRNIYVDFSYNPSYSNTLPDADKELPHISCLYRITSTSKSTQIQLYYSQRVFSIKSPISVKAYSKADLLSFLHGLVDDYISSEV